MKQHSIFPERLNRKNRYYLIFTMLLLIGSPLSVSAEPQQEHDHAGNKVVQDHDEGDAHHGGHEEPALNFSLSQLKEFSISLVRAKPGIISKTRELTGEVIVAPERLYHVVPRVSGVVRQVYKHLGDAVKAGDLLAVLSSRGLADAKANFVAADSLLQLANTNLQREKKLFKEQITAKRNYYKARQAYAEMSIKRKAAKQRLLALGLTEQSINSILKSSDKDLTRYELRAPADGVIIEKHAVHGEVLDTNTRSFTIADLSEVWVNLTVYQKDLPFIIRNNEYKSALDLAWPIMKF